MSQTDGASSCRQTYGEQVNTAAADPLRHPKPLVERVSSRLDERHRGLIALEYGADLTARQIASLLGVRTNTIEVTLHRVLGRLHAGSVGDESKRCTDRRLQASPGMS